MNIKGNKKLFTEKIYENVKQDIINGKYRFGEKLNIDKLSKSYNVSITPVREAVNRLSQDGLVNFIPNVGVHVLDINLEKLREIIEAAYYYEVLSINYISEKNLLKETITDLEYIIKKQKEAYELSDNDGFFKYSYEFHNVFFYKIDNPVLLDRFNNFKVLYMISANFFNNNFKTHKGKSIAEHVNIKKALENNDLPLVFYLIKEHYFNSYYGFSKLF